MYCIYKTNYRIESLGINYYIYTLYESWLELLVSDTNQIRMILCRMLPLVDLGEHHGTCFFPLFEVYLLQFFGWK